jgi:BlaI family transcriptional regulator, penicillinase repressor
MPDLPDAELEVLACVQKRGRATVREVREAMLPYRPLSHPSVLTLLTRLEARGFVRREKGDVGKAFVYLPTQQARSTVRHLLKKVVQRVFHGDGVAMVTSLLQSKPPTPDELNRLEQLLRDLRAKRAEKGRGP